MDLHTFTYYFSLLFFLSFFFSFFLWGRGPPKKGGRGRGRIKKKNEKKRCNLNYTVPTSVKSGPYSVSAEAGVRYKKWSPKFISHSSGAV